MKLTLTKVYRTNRNKDGDLLKTKDGREYSRLSIKTQEYGEKWISGFAAGWNMGWQEGDTVEAEVKQNGEYLNLERLDPIEQLRSEIQSLTARVTALETQRPTETTSKPEVPQFKVGADVPPDEPDIDVSDIPF